VDPDEFDSCLMKLHERARTAARGADVELYGRASSTTRAMRLPGGRQRFIVGSEEGIAVRTRSRKGHEAGFAAHSGLGDASVEWAVAEALACPRWIGEHSWPECDSGPRIDRDLSDAPTRSDLSQWLHRAWERLSGSPRSGRPAPAPVAGWVEVAATVEGWVADGGLRASRSRVRAWALVEMAPARGGLGGVRPIQVARRRFQDLAESAWAGILEDRWLPGQGSRPAAARRASVLFNPECAASLLHAVVKSQQTPAQESLSVGPGWKIADDPVEPGALFGSRFDDAGFRTQRTVLADGSRWTGVLSGKGHYRRPSFRDPPAPAPSGIVAFSEPAAPPGECVLVSGMALHALGPDRWILQVDAAEMAGSRPGPCLEGAFIRTSPGELAQRCVATVGPARRSHLGALTPALLFEGLEIDAS
jgi:hypothetical protein